MRVDKRVLGIACLMVALAAAGLYGCNKGDGTETTGGQSGMEPTPASGLTGTLTVLVPCGQLGPYMEAKKIFTDKHPGVTIDQVGANINDLMNGVLAGKHSDADVFLDMGDTAIEKLAEAGAVIDETTVAYAKSYVAVIVPTENPAGIKKFEDLGKPEVKTIGIAEPSENSNGEYSVEALKSAGLWEKLESDGKILIVDQPAQLKVLVGMKKVDAAFIYGPCVHEAAKGETKPAEGVKKATLVGNVPEDLYSPFYCTASVLTDTDNEAAAREFVKFLESDECNEVWQAWYFGLPASRADEKAEAILVHCGAGIRPPMDELADLFEERTGTRVDMAYKGSGCLLADIEFSRKGDLYMPGEQDYMDQAIESGFIVEHRPVATMQTVIITPLEDEHGINSLEDLAKPGVKVGLGAVPQVAVGVAAKKTLDKAGLWDSVQKNVKMNVLNVVELADAVKLGGIDAAIVWDATAYLVKDDVRTVPIDPKYAYQTTIPFGALKFSKHPDKAQLFLELAASAEGTEIFEAHGYGPVEG